MPTTGTIYDETVKNGFSKLLSAQVTNAVSQIVFTVPATGHDSFLFSLDNLYCDDTGATPRLCMQVSKNGGSTWETSYWWSRFALHTNLAGMNYHSHLDQTVAANVLPISLNNQQGHCLGGYVRLFTGSAADVEIWTWRCAHWGSYPGDHHGAGYQPASNSRCNAVRFFYSVGNIYGAIRLYGLKTGA